jgi:16S rRNA (guanine966-N2)-methyltransferase
LATFVDNDKTAVAAIRANVDALGLAAQATVVTSDVIRWLDGAGSADVAFVDPPYAFDDWATLLGALAVELAVCESDRAIDAPEGWTIRNVRQHGGTLVSLLERRGAAP